MRLTICLAAAISLLSLRTVAQKPLHIGDKVPEIVLKHVINTPAKQIKLSDFKGKYVILDFWGTTCTSCIGAFPKMHQLQKEFGKDLQILLVNPYGGKWDTEARVRETLRTYENRTSTPVTLPVALFDSVLTKYFPHRSVPHEVIIDRKGYVAAITPDFEITRENLLSLTTDRYTAFTLKDDFLSKELKPILLEESKGAAAIRYRSIFTGFLDGVGETDDVRGRGDTTTGETIRNKPLRQFVYTAYSKLINGLMDNRIRWDVKDPEMYRPDMRKKNLYCYDLIIPATRIAEYHVDSYLREDLKRSFYISAERKTETMDCYVVRATTASDRLIVQDRKSVAELAATAKKKYIHHFPISDALRLLNLHATPFVSENLNPNQLIDIDFPEGMDLMNAEAIAETLRKSGFDVRKETRTLDVVVITDQKN